MRLGGIEGGGTKFICAVGDEFGNIEKELVILTTTPEETLNKVIAFFKENKIEKLGIGCFGPLQLDKNSNDYGCILNTPKKGWSNFNIVKYIKNYINIPININTDVNTACLAELKIGNSKNVNNLLYITIGTGIGVGAIINNQFLYGITHPEMGHIYLKRHPEDNFEGVCPIHKDCFEGLASGPSIEKRYNIKGQNIQKDHKVWDILGYYIGQAIVNYSLILSPNKIIIGGGVSSQKQLLPIIKKYLNQFNNNYIKNEYITNIDSYIEFSSLNNRAGLIGAILLSNL